MGFEYSVFRMSNYSPFRVRDPNRKKTRTKGGIGHGPATPYTRKRIAQARENEEWAAMAGPVTVRKIPPKDSSDE